MQRVAVWHHRNDPDERVLNARIMARAAIEFFESRSRDTKRSCRRKRAEEARYTSNERPDTPAEELRYEPPKRRRRRRKLG